MDENEKMIKQIEEGVNKLTEEEKTKRKETYEAISTAISVVAFIIGLIAGIKYYFMDPEHGFVVDLLATGILIVILEVIGNAVYSSFIEPLDL